MTLVAYPIAAGEGEEELSAECARGMEIDILDRRLVAQLCGTGAQLEAFVLTPGPLMFEQDIEPFERLGQFLQTLAHPALCRSGISSPDFSQARRVWTSTPTISAALFYEHHNNREYEKVSGNV